ncbi:MAG: tetratricopeptide repeat protein [Saccharofermentanales bacterium]
MNHWVSRHKIMVFLLYNAFAWAAFLLVNTELRIQFVWWFVYGFVILIISIGFVNSCTLKENNNAILYLDRDCNPQAFLDVIEDQLSYSKSKPYIQQLMISKSVCLRNLGRQDESFKILQDINIDRYASTIPATKILYYNNLCAGFIVQKDYVIAKVWLDKAFQMLRSQKINPKYKKMLNTALEINRNNIDLYNGKLDGIEEFFIEIRNRADSKRLVISAYFTLGELYVLQGRVDEAKSSFQYVIDNGNLLYSVVEAKEYIEKI